MTSADARAAIDTLHALSANPSRRVEVAVTSRREKHEPQTRSLALNDGARGFFAGAALTVAGKLEGADALVEYDATYKPDALEFEWAPLSEFPAVELAISALTPFSTLGSYSPDDRGFTRHLRYTTTVLRHEQQSAYLFRSFTSKHELSQRRGVSLAFRDGRFGIPTERVFQFDEDADAVVLGDVLIVIHKRSFQRIFDVLEAVYATAREAAVTLRAKVPIANFDAFQEAVGKDSNLADKVIAVTRRDYFPQLDMAAIEATNERFNVGVPIVLENGVKSLQFLTGPGERWRLLKLLDDDYLTSTMTKAMYDVNSKHPHKP